MVVGTNRIATVPSRLALHYAKSLPIRILPPPLDFPEVFEVVQWNKHQEGDLAIQWLRHTLLEGAARLQAPVLAPALLPGSESAPGKRAIAPGKRPRKGGIVPTSG
jgi:LysR family nod box-dependent transcriptional activator